MDLVALLALLATLAEMTLEEVAQLRADIAAAAETLAEGDVGADEVALLAQAADGVEAIDAELTTRAEAAAELETARDAALARIRGEVGDGEGDEDAGGDADDDAGDGNADTDTGDGTTEDGDDETAAPETAADEPLPIAAAAAPVPATPRARPVVPARHRPQPAAARATGTGIVAAGDIKGRTAGSEFATLAEVGRAIADKASVMGRSIGGDGEQVSVALRDWSDEYPDDRRLLDTMSADAVHERVMSIVMPARTVDAVVAAGGLCAPVAVRYQLVTYGSTGRPVRDSLPSFLADRGGVTYNDSPQLTDILVDNANGAIDTITLAEDAAGATKTLQEVTCGDPHTEYVYAITEQLKNGNLAQRFNPERMDAWVKLMDVAHARHAEKLLLQAMIARRTKHFTNTIAEFGAYRDLKRAVLGTIAEIRDQLRDDNVAIRIQMPGYVPTMLVTDLVAQQPGDSTFQWTDAQMRADMQTWAAGVNFTFSMDSAATSGRMLSTPTGQSPRTPGFDADVDFIVYPEGTFVFLDGGGLDLGIIRDSTLVAANRFITFSETMEGLARFGPLAYHVTSSLCAGGDSQVATDIAACSPQGS